MNKVYTEDFKRESVHYALGHPEKSRLEIAKELGVPYGTFKAWFHSVDTSEFVSIQSTTPKTPRELEVENRKLKSELALKEKEVELLKKFNVYLARQG